MIWLVLQLIGLSIDSAWIRLQLAATAEMIAGAVIFCLALFIAAAAIPRHERGGSNIEPWKPTTAIFTDGVYGRSRNPIYLSMLIDFAAISIAAGCAASFALLVLFWAILRFYVIAREERYLEAKFGQQYNNYRNSVRRWI
ncbi:MAG: isoprenylcysteine carboxylmethyltransferase family protein [Alphaproteobacteria bacterium]